MTSNEAEDVLKGRDADAPHSTISKSGHERQASLEGYRSLTSTRTGGLRCPHCDEGELMRLVDRDACIEVVIFECMFSATFSLHDSEDRKSRLLARDLELSLTGLDM